MIHRNPPETITLKKPKQFLPSLLWGGGTGKDTEVVLAHLY